MPKVLLAEDNTEISKKLCEFLVIDLWTVEAVDNGQDALEHLRFYDYDVIILDWNLPGLSGLDVCREFRLLGGSTPILMLTARTDIADRIEGLNTGADDYLIKPFHAKELTARLRALLRRPAAVTEPVLKAAYVTLDPVTHAVVCAGKAVQLQPLEFALLEFLMRHRDQVFSPEALLDRVWHSNSDATVDSLRTCVKMLRRKIHVDGKPSIIATVHGVGYKVSAGNS